MFMRTVKNDGMTGVRIKQVIVLLPNPCAIVSGAAKRGELNRTTCLDSTSISQRSADE